MREGNSTAARRPWTTFLALWWLPMAVVPLLGGAIPVSREFFPNTLRFMALALDAAILCIAVSAVVSFVMRRWRRGVLALVLFPIAWVLCFVRVHSGPATPEVPAPRDSVAAVPAIDRQGQALIDAISVHLAAQTAPGPNPISVDLPVLNEFGGPDRQLLLRHLATSAQWCLTQERGRPFAYRRFVINGRWLNTLNGFYSAHDFAGFPDRNFQFRMGLDPDGPPPNLPWLSKETLAKVSDHTCNLGAIEDKANRQGIESYLVLTSSRAALEIFEQSPSFARPFTPRALQQIDEELRSVLASAAARDQGFDPSLMPAESIKKGPPEIHIVDGMQGGIYHIIAYANPRENGYVYIKAFDASTDAPLSAARIPQDSTGWMGWSSDPNQQFYYSSEITIGEGNWGTFYPARIELWFVPDSGKPERELVGGSFKICGWER